jgi:pimeloyl-ACP methyl ester carboxylesterase
MAQEINKAAISDSGGAGKILVFLHGFCESKAIWPDFTKPLAPEYRLVFLDLPGHGENTAPHEAYSMEHNADFVREALESLQINKCVLIGHSMGGYTAMAFAEKYLDLLSGVVLFHSSALPDTAEKKESRNKTIDFIRKHGVEKFMETFVAPLFYEGNRQQQQAVIEQLTNIGKKVALEAVIGTLAAMRDRQDRTSVLAKAKVPFLFIAGKQDPAVSLEQTLQQCHLPQISYTLFLDQTGHMGIYERPKETLAAFRGFAGAV